MTFLNSGINSLLSKTDLPLQISQGKTSCLFKMAEIPTSNDCFRKLQVFSKHRADGCLFSQELLQQWAMEDIFF